MRLEAIAELPDDWDGESSPGADPCLIRSALELLARIQAVSDTAVPVPDVCPVAGGGFQLEWECGSKSLEIEFLTANRLGFLTEDELSQGRIVKSGEYPTARLQETLALVEWLVQE